MTIPNVSQEAREAAADLLIGIQRHGLSSPVLTRIEAGKHDDWYFVQVFKEFESLIRTKVIEEAAGVADEHHVGLRGIGPVGRAQVNEARRIAEAIRQLGERGR